MSGDGGAVFHLVLLYYDLPFSSSLVSPSSDLSDSFCPRSSSMSSGAEGWVGKWGLEVYLLLLETFNQFSCFQSHTSAFRRL
jgi:hypothetical protein